jgi:hypothetical protein
MISTLLARRVGFAVSRSSFMSSQGLIVTFDERDLTPGSG